MWNKLQVRNPYVTGAPIQAVEDFIGRESELASVVDRIRRGQSVAIIASPRMGATSFLNRLLQPDVAERLSDEATCLESLDCANLIRQPVDFYRRLARLIRAHDPEAAIDHALTDEGLLADQVSEAIGRARCRWVLLLDNFEALASFPAHFFNHLRSLASRGAPVLVLTSRVPLHDLGLATNRSGSPFWNVVQTVPLGPWTINEFDEFMTLTSRRSGVDLSCYRDEILGLAGRTPAFVQYAAFHFFEAASRGAVDTLALRSTITEALRSTFAQLWESTALKPVDRDVLVSISYGRAPNANGSTGGILSYLTRSGYLNADGSIASQLFAAFLRSTIPRIVMQPDRREVMVEGEGKALPRRDYDLLLYLYSHQGTVCTTEDILENVWGYTNSNRGVGDDTMVYQRIRALRLAVEEDPKKPRHILNVPGTGYKFVNYARGE